MKKYLCFLIALLLTACLLPVSAAERCEACGQTVVWEAMPAKVPTDAGHYHYALEADQTISQWQLKDGVTVCLDLKGHTLRSSGRMFNLSSGSELNILDSVGTGYAIATTGSNNVTGGVITIAENAKCSQYGGTLQLETKYVSGKGVGAGGIVYMNKACTYNLYGGVIQGADLVKSEYTLTWNGYGAAFYLGSSARLNVYGGQILSGSVPEGGKGACVFVQTLGARVTVTGNAKLEEVYYNADNDQFVVEGCYTGSAALAYNDTLNIIQGSVLGKCEGANLVRADIRCRDWMLTGQDGKLVTIPDSEAALCGETTAYFPTVQEAVSAAEGGYVKLLKNDLVFSADKAITLDLNGQNATVNGSGALTVFDSQTDDHTVADGIYGQLTADNVIAAAGYLQVQEDGDSFHKVSSQIESMVLRPDAAGVYYKSRVFGDELVQKNVLRYGVALNAFEAPNAGNMGSTSKFSEFTAFTAGADGCEAPGTLLKGILKERNSQKTNEKNGDTAVYGSAYVQTADGSWFFSEPVSRDLRQQTEAADTLWGSLDAIQKDGLMTMFGKFEGVMESWTLPNLRGGYLEETLQIFTQRGGSHGMGNTVNPGEKLTYTLTLTNRSDKTQTATIREPVPTNTTYLSGGTLKGEEILFRVTLAAGETKELSYQVQVNNDPALLGGGSVLGGGMELFIEYTFNQIDGQYFVDALQALSDSTYSGMDLADRLYVHGYTQNALTNNSVTDTALEDILAGENAALLDMVAPGLFGGSKMPETIEGVKGAAGAVSEKALISGDILLVDGKVYAYGNGLWSLEVGAKRVDTAAVLAALPEAEKYAVLRPSVVLADRLTPTDPDAPLDELNDYQKALIATAEAYLLRGEKLQYADTRFTAQGSTIGTEFRWQSKVNAPEDCTSTQWGYTNCAAFTYEVYYQALGFALPDDMYTTLKLTNNCAANGTQVYHYNRAVDSVQTEEEKAQVEQEFMSKLQPGDILVVLRNGSSGHAMLYVGNGNIIHSSGSVYQYTASVGTEVYEASIRRMKVRDYFFNPNSAKGYVFGIVTDLTIVRPLQIFEGPIPQNTQNRVANMQGIMAQKLSSHAKSQTVNPGDEMTFTYEVYNTRDSAVTLEILERLPANTTYLSGAETVDGDQLRWQVTVPAEGRVQVSYKLKVNEGTAYGTVIQSTDSTVGGITVKCAPVQVRRTFTAAEQVAMIEKVKQLRAEGNTLTGLALANEIYKAATGEILFASTDIEAVTEGADGIFAKKQMSASRQIFEMNSGSHYENLVAPTLYGGYRLWTPLWQHDRARLPREHDLQAGDLLIGRTLSSRVMYLYLGQEFGIVRLTTATLDADTIAPAARLERVHGYGYYFAILRPSFALEN